MRFYKSSLATGCRLYVQAAISFLECPSDNILWKRLLPPEPTSPRLQLQSSTSAELYGYDEVLGTKLYDWYAVEFASSIDGKINDFNLVIATFCLFLAN